MDTANCRIDRNSPLPLYYQLKSLILAEIQSEKFLPHETIPTESELCKKYDVSRATVRQAILELVNEGKVYRIKGKGTFVSPPQQVQTDVAYAFTSFLGSAQEMGIAAEMQVDSIQVIDAPQRVADILSLDAGKQVVWIHRHQRSEDTIFSYIDSYMPYPRCSCVMDDTKLRHEPLHKMLNDAAETKMDRIFCQISVYLATSFDAKELESKVGDPIIQVEFKGRSSLDGEIILCEWANYIGEKNKIVFEQRLNL